MPNVTATVKYVNPPKPGKQRGSIKCADDAIYGVFPDKMHIFEAGKTYEIEYTEKSVDGVTYKTVKSAVPVESSAAKPSAAPNAGYGAYRETSARDAQRMFACSILNAAIQGGQVAFNRQQLSAAVTLLRGVWDDTFGQADGVPAVAPAPPARVANGNGRYTNTRQDLADEIPF